MTQWWHHQVSFLSPRSKANTGYKEENLIIWMWKLPWPQLDLWKYRYHHIYTLVTIYDSCRLIRINQFANDKTVMFHHPRTHSQKYHYFCLNNINSPRCRRPFTNPILHPHLCQFSICLSIHPLLLSFISPHLFVLVSVTPFQSLCLAAGLLEHVVHWLERSGNTLCLSSHTIYYLDWESPRTQELVLTWTWTDTHTRAHTHGPRHAQAGRHTQSHNHTSTRSHTERNISNTLPLSVRTSARSLHPSHTDVPLGTSAGCGGAALGAFLEPGGGRQGPNRAPEPGWELPLWDTKHCLCWERPWGWEHRPELDTE